jgi:hypothetical protein
VDVTKPTDSSGKYKFCVIFDEAICTKENWVDEPTLDMMDKMREQSLFKIYNIPQKCQQSINSSNVKKSIFFNSLDYWFPLFDSKAPEQGIEH